MMLRLNPIHNLIQINLIYPCRAIPLVKGNSLEFFQGMGEMLLVLMILLRLNKINDLLQIPTHPQSIICPKSSRFTPVESPLVKSNSLKFFEGIGEMLFLLMILLRLNPIHNLLQITSTHPCRIIPLFKRNRLEFFEGFGNSIMILRLLLLLMVLLRPIHNPFQITPTHP